MKKQILLGLGALVLISALIGIARQLAAPTTLPAADAATFARANQLYEKGQYDAAIHLYQQLVAQGVENADLYFNLGNAYAARGDAGKASDAFARARKLAPRDPQIAQAASASGFALPLTQNEIALIALGAVSLCAVATVLMRPRSLEKTA